MSAPATARAPRTFFDEVGAVWERAAASAGVESRTFGLADTTMHLEFAGAALVEPLTRALAHLAPRATGERLTVHLWDSESTGVAMLRPPWGVEAYAEHGRVADYCDDELFTAVERWGRRSLVMVELARGEAYVWSETASNIPYYEVASPLKLVLHAWLRSRGAHFVHAGAVGSERGCLLVGGRPGSGKSSAALACLAAGWRFVADDYCVLRAGRPPRVASLYSSAKADTDLLERLPVLEPLVSNPQRPAGDKAVLFVHEPLPRRVLLESEVRAVLLPRVTGARETRLTPASPAAALAAIAPSTLFQLPGDGTAAFQRLSEAVRLLPCHHLELGERLEDVPAAIGGLLAER